MIKLSSKKNYKKNSKSLSYKKRNYKKRSYRKRSKSLSYRKRNYKKRSYKKRSYNKKYTGSGPSVQNIVVQPYIGDIGEIEIDDETYVFDVKQNIGKGSYGTVHILTKRDGLGEKYAVKIEENKQDPLKKTEDPYEILYIWS